MNKVLLDSNRGYQLLKRLIGLTPSGGALLRASVLFFIIGHANADVSVDIRASKPLGTGSNSDFIAHIDDCQNLVSIKVGSSSQLTQISPADANRNLLSPISCEVDFQLASDGLIAPLLELGFLDGVMQSHTEQFYEEATAPTIQLNTISIRSEGEKQYLDISLDTFDNLDITYVAVQAVGLRASALRTVGGVIDETRVITPAGRDHVS